MQVRRQPITLEDKLRYMREVESIHRLSKTTLPPQGKTWAQVADGILKKALGLPVVERPENFNISSGRHHQHSPRSARIIERTLRNGVVHPDVLHSYRGDYAPLPVADTPAVRRHRPAVPGRAYGFVPGTHNVASHVQLEQSVRPATDVVPT